jgi:hypothetical protein
LSRKLTGNNGTANLLGGNLGHVQNDNGRDETDTETSNDATSSHKTKTSRGALEDTSDGEDTATQDDGEPTTNEICEITSDDGAEESTSRQDRGDQGLVARRDGEEAVAVVDDLWVAGKKTRELDVGVFVASVLLDEVVHVEDTSHPTGIITKEDTSKGCESNNQVRPNGDGGFDTVDIGRAGDGGDSAAWHLDGRAAVKLLGEDVLSKKDEALRMEKRSPAQRWKEE